MIQQRARDTVALYREHFLGKGHMSNIDPVTYYSQALSYLGEGFDVYFQFTADKLDAKPNGGAMKARFASVEDLVTEVTRRVRETAGRYENPYF